MRHFSTPDEFNIGRQMNRNVIDHTQEYAINLSRSCEHPIWISNKWKTFKNSNWPYNKQCMDEQIYTVTDDSVVHFNRWLWLKLLRTNKISQFHSIQFQILPGFVYSKLPERRCEPVKYPNVNTSPITIMLLKPHK